MAGIKPSLLNFSSPGPFATIAPMWFTVHGSMTRTNKKKSACRPRATWTKAAGAPGSGPAGGPGRGGRRRCSNTFSQADGDPTPLQVRLGLTDRDLPEMEDRGGKGRIGPPPPKGPAQMLHRPGPPPAGHGDTHAPRARARPL